MTTQRTVKEFLLQQQPQPQSPVFNTVLADLQHRSELAPGDLSDVARLTTELCLRLHEEFVRTQKNLWADREALGIWLENITDLERAVESLMKVC